MKEGALKEEEEAGAVQFAPARRKAVRVSPSALVRAGFLEEAPGWPRLIEPGAEGVELAGWARANREAVGRELAAHGAVLFRGFGVESAQGFEQFIEATSGGALEYGERSSPRTQVAGNVYTSTDYPPEQSIFLHNEQSYNSTFPLKIYFCCLQPARQGGATPIADTRRVFKAIEPKLRERFVERKYMYVRNFGDGFGLAWQTAFQTSSRAAVEQYCRAHDIEFEWKEGDRLRTRQVRPVVARHPGTGDAAWFNHATFFHVSTLEPRLRDRLLEEFAEEDLPNNTYYGDGSPIEPSVMQALRHAYVEAKVSFPWQKGDILALDNVLTAHGRDPFVGPRSVVAGMADPFSWSDI
jgi:alpha-ketoglutarate-dependent taurine dioxygenase